MKHIVVYNPLSISKEEITKLVKENFDGLDAKIVETIPHHQTINTINEIVKKEKEAVRVYACGGDGTISDVANGLVGLKNTELAIYPCGTGNDFAKIYGGKNKLCNFKNLISWKASPIDLSKITNTKTNESMYSINVINFGFDAIVGAMGNFYKTHGIPENAPEKFKNDPYGYALKYDAMKHGRFNQIVVYADGEKLNDNKMLLCTLSQGQFVGGKFHCAPKSDNTDGLIDVCLIKTMTLLHFGLIVGPYTEGKHLNKKRRKFVYRQSKTIQIAAPTNIDICVDGEMIKGTNFEINICPGAINLVKPE